MIGTILPTNVTTLRSGGIENSERKASPSLLRCSSETTNGSRSKPNGTTSIRLTSAIFKRIRARLTSSETAINLVLQTRGPDANQDILDAARAQGFSVRVERQA